MGSLWDWEISPEFVRQFPIFIETGYGTGNGLEYAVKHDFRKIYSIEIYPAAAAHGRDKFCHDKRVEIIEEDSPIGIGQLLSRPEGNMFFWLDAHFPGADCFGKPFDSSDMRVRLPLQRELECIRGWCRRDYTVLIDDLRYFADLPWQEGPPTGPAAEALPEGRYLDFLKPFCATHHVQIFLN
jgi:hypothetical protein